jgi:hypothetical protein
MQKIDSLRSPFGLLNAVFLRFAPILSSCLKVFSDSRTLTPLRG